MVTRGETDLRRSFYLLGSLTLSGMLLYWAQPVLIPVTMAILAAFLLAPVVDRLERWHLPRFVASTITVLGAAIVLLGVMQIFLMQVQSLVSELPEYRTQVKEKMARAREATAETWIVPIVDFANDLSKPESTNGKNGAVEAVAAKLEIPLFPMVRSAAGTAVELLAGFVLVLVLALLMLLRREDLRNRLVHFLGPDNLVSATRALDDASMRVSRFLLFQLILNLVFGALVAVGLYLIGIPYAYIWGAMAALLRYVPFLGGWIAAGFPLLVSLGLPGWTPFFLTAFFFCVLELVQANLVEPLVFGHSIGVSGVGQLVAALFWACLWGPVGLILSTPLTACLCVLGRHFPVLRFFSDVMGDEEIVERPATFYQRLLAGDSSEAADLLEDFLKDHSASEAQDEILLPALLSARSDQEHGELTKEDCLAIVETIRDVAEVIPPPDDEQANSVDDTRANVLALEFPFNDEIDVLAVEMLRRTATPAAIHWSSITATNGRLDRESLSEAVDPAVIVLTTSAKKHFARLRGACRSARALFPDSKIVVGIWSLAKDSDALRARLKETGASVVCTTLAEGREAVAAGISNRTRQATELVH